MAEDDLSKTISLWLPAAAHYQSDAQVWYAGARGNGLCCSWRDTKSAGVDTTEPRPVK